jgi:hypothetical protein
MCFELSDHILAELATGHIRWDKGTAANVFADVRNGSHYCEKPFARTFQLGAYAKRTPS